MIAIFFLQFPRNLYGSFLKAKLEDLFTQLLALKRADFLVDLMVGNMVEDGIGENFRSHW